MALDGTVLAGLLVLSGLVSTAVAVFLWNERPKSGATPLLFVELSLAIWAFGQAAVIAGESLQVALGGYVVTLVGFGIIGPALLLFALEYTGYSEYVTTRSIVALAVPGVAAVSLGAVNVGELMWVDPQLTTRAGQTTLDLGFGPAFWVFVAVIYPTLLAGDYLLYSKFVSSRNVYRKRSFFFLSYSVLLTACHLLSSAGFSPTPHYTLVPLANLLFGSLSVLVFVGFRTYEFLPLQRVLERVGSQSKNLAPVARNTVIEEMGTGMLVIDHKNRIVDINPMGRAMLGQTDGRVVGKRVGEVLPSEVFVDDDVPFYDPEISGDFSGIWVQPPVGDQRCFDTTITSLDAEEDDEAGGRVALIHDVTERERRKRKLEERTDELERQNDQLEDFAGIVSHDLRNPLNVAENAIDLTRRREEFDFLEKAENAHDRMENIIEDVLTLARQGQTVSDTESVSVGNVADEGWGNVDTADATLELEEDLTVVADRKRLLQAFENLFRNAVEHAGNDVTVRIGRTDDGFYVEDDGPGIPAAEREDVLDQGYTTSEHGTGFGLSIVTTVVDAHGWEITVTEGSEGGARFEITGLGGGEERTSESGVVA